MAGAKRIGTGVTAGPCENCGSTDNYSQWQSGNQKWLSCANKVNGQFCNGKPQAEHGIERVATPPGGSRSEQIGSVFDRMADTFAQLSALMVEAAAIMNGE